MKKLVILCLLSLSLFAETTYSLKPRQPNWRVEIKERYDTASPKLVMFYEPDIANTEKPV